MAKLRSNNGMKNGIENLKFVVKSILQKRLSLSKKLNSSDDDHEEIHPSYVPEDVKEGHFTVIAIDSEEPKKRFVVSLNYLSHPKFIRLLEEAAEEYGFDRKGALTIPCRPSELERFLADEQLLDQSRVGVTAWDTNYHHSTIVQSF